MFVFSWLSMYVKDCQDAMSTLRRLTHPVIMPPMPRDYPLIPCLSGILDGDEKPLNPTGWLYEVTAVSVHRYILAQEDDGSRVWSYTGCVPLASKVA